MKYFLHHLLLPRHSNNHRAKILHFPSILILSGLLLIANFFLLQFRHTYPNVLGSAVNISAQELLRLTNEQRAQNGLSALAMNDQLANAAAGKAQDMFTDDYWAHISPKTGKTPWMFIQAAGYSYTYAGENLARGFSSPQDVINAWMASPTHRANVLSRNYQDVGFAIRDGNLTGETDTTLVVEEFGGKGSAPLIQQAQAAEPQQSAQVPVATLTPTPTPTPTPILAVIAQGNNTQVQYQNLTTSPVIDRFAFAKNVTEFLILLFIVIFILDFILIERRQIARLVGHNIDHIFFLTAILLIIGVMGAGSLL